MLLELCHGEPRLDGGGLLTAATADSTGCYAVENGCCRCTGGAIVIQYLADHGPDDGGLAVVVGSHKSEVSHPFRRALPSGLLQVEARAGDLIVLTAATRHEIVAGKHGAPRALRLRFKPAAAPNENQLIEQSSPDMEALRDTEHGRRPEKHAVWVPGRSTRAVADGGASRSEHDSGADSGSGMTPQQRYLFDCHGFLHLKGVLSPTELTLARAAFERARLRSSPSRGIQAPSNVDGEPVREPALEMLATHPALLPVLLELGEGAPHLTGMSLIYNPPRTGPPQTTGKYGGLHCHGDFTEHDGEIHNRRDNVSFSVKAGKVTTDDWVVFPYLEKVEVGDGGLGIVPGSPKANFPRPPAVAWPYGSLPHNGGAAFDEVQECLTYTRADGSSGLRTPDGMVQVTPEAGDFIVISERCAHCILPWQPTDRPRMALNLRFYAGAAWERLEKRATTGDLDDSLTVSENSPDCELA